MKKQFETGDLVRVVVRENKGFVYEIKGISKNIIDEDIYLYTPEAGKTAEKIEPVTHLTTKEFIKLVEDMGLETKEYKYDVRFIEIKNNGIIIGNIYLDRMYFFELDEFSTEKYLDFPKLYKLLDLYARTPLKLREEKEEETILEKMAEIISNGEICEKVFEEYFGDTEIGFMSKEEIIEFVLKEEINNEK